MQTTAEGRKETQKAEAFEPRADVARDPASGEPMEFPSATPALAAKAKDLEALRDAVVDAANVGAGLWLTYLFVLFYLLVAVGSVTHRDLFFESPIRLPFLSVDLPLVGFFVLGPALFLIVHTYVLLHFVMLADKVACFTANSRRKSSTRTYARACAGSCRATSSCSFSPGRARCAEA